VSTQPRRVGAAPRIGRGGGAHASGRLAPAARVLDEDPELGEDLGEAELAAAREPARAAVMVLRTGEWRPRVWPASLREGFGLLVLDGLLLRRVRVCDRAGVELLAAGDQLRPWQWEAGASVPREPGWRVLEPCRLALLDRDFAQRISAHPAVATALTARAMRRSRNLAVNLAIVQQPKVETRLRMLLWHLADRFGTVGPQGVSLPLRLQQTILAALVAAQRPTVSAALGALERGGELTRTPEGWLLHGAPPGELGA
jgi:CRP-like cAMP-binding protein